MTSSPVTPATEPRVGPAPLGPTVGITTWGTLWWLAFAWGAGIVVVGGIFLVLGIRDNEPDNSLWEVLGAGWQRWVMLFAGASMVSSFLPMVVVNGVTRARLSTAATITMAIVATAAGLYTVLGFALEDLVYAWGGWPHLSVDDEAIGGLSFVSSTWLLATVTLAAYFMSGWLCSIGITRFGRDVGWPLVIPSLLPAVGAELLLDQRAGGFGLGFVFDRFDDLGQPPSAVGVPAVLAIIALACVVARRATAEVPMK